MYTLTEIAEDNVHSHDYLGYGFSVIDKERSPSEFVKAYGAYIGNNGNYILV